MYNITIYIISFLISIYNTLHSPNYRLITGHSNMTIYTSKINSLNAN